MNRRSVALSAVAALAGLAGAGVAWQRFQPHADHDGHGSQGSHGDKGEAQALWGQTFETPDGKPLPMQAYKGKPVLVNFWATWCPPCVEELPLLDSFYKTHQAANWVVVGLAVDQPSAVRQWLAAKPLSFPIGMAGLGGTELAKTLGNRTGGLPYSVVLGAEGGVLHRKMGKIVAEDLAQWSRLS